jgi:hypothetical protein
MDSFIIAAEPLIMAAKNLMTVTILLEMMAVITAVLDPWAILFTTP